MIAAGVYSIVLLVGLTVFVILVAVGTGAILFVHYCWTTREPKE